MTRPETEPEDKVVVGGVHAEEILPDEFIEKLREIVLGGINRFHQKRTSYENASGTRIGEETEENQELERLWAKSLFFRSEGATDGLDPRM